jgi:hypothetical protein
MPSLERYNSDLSHMPWNRDHSFRPSQTLGNFVAIPGYCSVTMSLKMPHLLQRLMPKAATLCLC